MMLYIIIAWLVCGFIDAGFFYAYFQREYPFLAREDKIEDTMYSLLAIVFGPFGLIASLFLGQTKHGWLFPGSDPFK